MFQLEQQGRENPNKSVGSHSLVKVLSVASQSMSKHIRFLF